MPMEISNRLESISPRGYSGRERTEILR